VSNEAALDPGEVSRFETTAVWREIKRILGERIEMLRDDLEKMDHRCAAAGAAAAMVQGEIYGLRNVLEQPERLRAEAEQRKEQTHDEEEG
jgi:F0F1-type ATP synthase membrane subunit b/b'